jgi:hypothetical protein
MPVDAELTFADVAVLALRTAVTIRAEAEMSLAATGIAGAAVAVEPASA